MNPCPQGYSDLYLPGWILNDNATTSWSLVNTNDYEVPVQTWYYNQYGQQVYADEFTMQAHQVHTENLRDTPVREEYGYIRYKSCGPLKGDFTKNGTVPTNQCDNKWAVSESLVKLEPGKHIARFYYDTRQDKGTEITVLRPNMPNYSTQRFEGYKNSNEFIGRATVPGQPLSTFDIYDLFNGEGENFEVPTTWGWMQLDCGLDPCIVCTMMNAGDGARSTLYCW